MQKRIAHLPPDILPSEESGITPGEWQRLSYIVDLLSQLEKMAHRTNHVYLADLIGLAISEGNRLRGP